MQLYFLEQIGGGGWDEAEDMVVRANSEQEARSIASDRYDSIWVDSTKVSCVVLSTDGDAGIICCNYVRG